MAIEVLNEWTYTKDSLVSMVVSMHSKLVMYFRATKTGVASAEVEVPGTTTDIYPAFEVDEDATYKYYIVDFTEILKFKFKNEGYTDELEFTSTSGGSQSLMMAPSVILEIRTRDSGGTEIDDLFVRADLCHLGHPFPNESGFNLWNIFASRQFKPLKWSNDTYNAIFAYTVKDIAVNNITTGKSFTYSSPLGPTYYNVFTQFNRYGDTDYF